MGMLERIMYMIVGFIIAAFIMISFCIYYAKSTVEQGVTNPDEQRKLVELELERRYQEEINKEVTNEIIPTWNEYILLEDFGKMAIEKDAKAGKIFKQIDGLEQFLLSKRVNSASLLWKMWFRHHLAKVLIIEGNGKENYFIIKRAVDELETAYSHLESLKNNSPTAKTLDYLKENAPEDRILRDLMWSQALLSFYTTDLEAKEHYKERALKIKIDVYMGCPMEKYKISNVAVLKVLGCYQGQN